MRPKSIEQYEIIYWVSIGLGLVTNVLGWQLLRSTLAAAAAQPGAPFPGTMEALSLAGFVVGLAINLSLLWLTARRGSDIARIIVSILFVIALVLGVRGITMAGLPPLLGVVGVTQAVLQAVLLYLLWGPAEGKAWFRARGKLA